MALQSPDPAPSPNPNFLRNRPTLVALGGAAFGVALTLLWLRPDPIVGTLGAQAPQNITNAAGKPAPSHPGAPLRAGAHVKAGVAAVNITLNRGVEITLLPHGEVTVLAAGARIEQGGVIIDATATVETVSVQTAAGDVILSNAKVQIRSTPGGSLTGGMISTPVTIVNVQQGLVRLRSPGGSLALETGGGGLLVAGRPPRRTDTGDTLALSAALVAAHAERLVDPKAEEEKNEDKSQKNSHVLLLPVAVPFPVAVPVVIPTAQGGGPKTGEVSGVVEIDGPLPSVSSPCPDGNTGLTWTLSGKRIAGVFVQVISPVSHTAHAPALAPIVIEQTPCGFSPRLIAVEIGARIEIRAGAGPSLSRVTIGTRRIQETLLSLGHPMAFVPAATGIFDLGADPLAGGALPTGYVAVSETPHFVITGSDGGFRFTGLPTGRCSVRAWHPRGGEQTNHFNLVEGKPAAIRFVFTAPPADVPPAPALATAPPAPALNVATPALTADPGAETPTPVPPAAPAIAAPGRHDDDGACRIAVAAESPVTLACADGGIAGAKRFMQRVVKAGRENGIAVACSNCHVDTKSFTLVPQAPERLASVLTTLNQTAFLTAYLRQQALDQLVQKNNKTQRR